MPDDNEIKKPETPDNKEKTNPAEEIAEKITETGKKLLREVQKTIIGPTPKSIHAEQAKKKSEKAGKLQESVLKKQRFLAEREIIENKQIKLILLPSDYPARETVQDMLRALDQTRATNYALLESNTSLRRLGENRSEKISESAVIKPDTIAKLTSLLTKIGHIFTFKTEETEEKKEDKNKKNITQERLEKLAAIKEEIIATQELLFNTIAEMEKAKANYQIQKLPIFIETNMTQPGKIAKESYASAVEILEGMVQKMRNPQEIQSILARIKSIKIDEIESWSDVTTQIKVARRFADLTEALHTHAPEASLISLVGANSNQTIAESLTSQLLTNSLQNYLNIPAAKDIILKLLYKLFTSVKNLDRSIVQYELFLKGKNK